MCEDTPLNHNFIKDGPKPYLAAKEWLKDNGSDIDLFLGETGRYLVDRDRYPASTDDGNLETTLWTVDTMLHATTINITRINMQLGVSMSYVAWDPIRYGHWRRAVRGPFYAHIFMADAIGQAHKTRVHELPGAAAKQHSAYSIYNSGILQRIAVLNMERLVSSPSTNRAHRTYKLNLDHDVKRITIHKLSAFDVEAQSNFSYAGKQYLIENEGKESNAKVDDTVTKPVNNASVVVSVDAAQAVLVKLHRSDDSNDTGNAATTTTDAHRREV